MTAELRRHARLPLVLLALLVAICVATLWSPPAGRVSWVMEVSPGLALVVALVLLYPRLPFSHWVYVGTFLHVLVLIYGGCYTYALTPLGNWAKEAFHLSRNHYDRVGHLALGVFPAFLTRELLLRRTPLRRGGWLYFLTVSVVLAVAAFWELLEWWTTLVVAGDVGEAFLGSQGDVWDAQWDMFLALLAALLVLPLLGRAHDRSMSRVPPAGP
jgi:putative membrane protein